MTGGAGIKRKVEPGSCLCVVSLPAQWVGQQLWGMEIPQYPGKGKQTILDNMEGATAAAAKCPTPADTKVP